MLIVVVICPVELRAIFAEIAGLLEYFRPARFINGATQRPKAPRVDCSENCVYLTGYDVPALDESRHIGGRSHAISVQVRRYIRRAERREHLAQVRRVHSAVAVEVSGRPLRQDLQFQTHRLLTQPVVGLGDHAARLIEALRRTL